MNGPVASQAAAADRDPTFNGALPDVRRPALYQPKANLYPRFATPRVGRCLFALSLLILTVGIVRADEQPNSAMMKPVRALAQFMSTLPAHEHATMFARDGLCIVENFAPFLFCGPDAAAAWEAGFRAHSADGGLSELAAHFGAAHDFGVVGDRAYFSLPTVWKGLTHGRTFEEHGAWAFVLVRYGTRWKIIGYGWGVTAYRELPH